MASDLAGSISQAWSDCRVRSDKSPPESYRSSNCLAVSSLNTSTLPQIADPDRPSAEQRTMLALSTTRCGVVRLFTNRSKHLRSPRRNRILRTGSPMRRIYRMYLLCKKFLLHYTSRSEVITFVRKVFKGICVVPVRCYGTCYESCRTSVA